MKQKKIIFTVFLFISLITFGQKQDKIFYDKDWKVCSQSNAEYYRLITFDEKGKPFGMVKDYYITGEIQWEGYCSFVDKYDNSKDISEGHCIWYYKNGRKSRESDMVNNLENGRTTYWYENGNKAREIDFSNGVPNGLWLDYYESGTLFRKFSFENGEATSKFFMECDEFGACQKVFLEYFLNQDNLNKWQLASVERDYKSSIISEKGLLMETKTEIGFRQTINIPLSLSEDFSIETSIDFKSGEKNSGHGLMWGYKDWDDYYYFNISANGFYQIGARTEGINLEFVKWSQSNLINQDYNRNILKVLRVGDKMYYSINGNLVHSDDFYAFRGNDIGFSILSGKKAVLFEYLIVKQDIETNLVTDNLPNSNSEGWKGNGTGFFISTDGYLATNYHVISEASEIEIEFIRNGQKQNYKAKVVQSDKQNDLAILIVDDNSFRPFISVPYNFQTSISDVGSNVFALGYPMALTVMGTEIKFTDGKISSKTGFQGDIATYQMTTPIQPGNSGGPLFDYDGNLIGINSSKIRSDYADNVSYAIKTNYLKNLIDVLPVTLKLPNDKTIMSKTLTEKIKIMSDYVVLIRIK
ncbi:MAG: trypsin-like peptidase domain-containing protein [Bacteroidales bacterium]|nr:trypsin-like peptidase domain-containing protein [Bacteroidales bacterium]